MRLLWAVILFLFALEVYLMSLMSFSSSLEFSFVFLFLISISVSILIRITFSIRNLLDIKSLFILCWDKFSGIQFVSFPIFGLLSAFMVGFMREIFVFCDFWCWDKIAKRLWDVSWNPEIYSLRNPILSWAVFCLVNKRWVSGNQVLNAFSTGMSFYEPRLFYWNWFLTAYERKERSPQETTRRDLIFGFLKVNNKPFISDLSISITKSYEDWRHHW